MTAALSVNRQVDLVIVRYALDEAFAMLVRIFKNPPPDLIPKLLTLVIRLDRIGRDEINRMLLTFSMDLSSVLRGPCDPLTIFWQGMIKMDGNQRKDATERVFALCLEEFEKQTEPSHDLPISIYLLYFDIFERQKHPREQVNSLRRELEEIFY